MSLASPLTSMLAGRSWPSGLPVRTTVRSTRARCTFRSRYQRAVDATGATKGTGAPTGRALWDRTCIKRRCASARDRCYQDELSGGADVGTGVAYVFTSTSAGQWVSNAVVRATQARAGDGFGRGIAINALGDVIAVVASAASNAPNVGAVYLFRSRPDTIASRSSEVPNSSASSRGA